MRSHSYINSAKNIIELYDGSIPLSIWLKQYFKEHKKHGSKDRKEIAQLCYSYYRLGNAFNKLNIEEKILLGVFLTSANPNFTLHELKPEWYENIQLSVDEKISFLKAEEQVAQLFAFSDEVSFEIDASQLSKSFLIQPLLYLRTRPNKKNIVIEKLTHAGVKFEVMHDGCIALANNTKVDKVIVLNEEAVVQDYNSQKILDVLRNSKFPIPNPKFSVWDCCAASGGKSILVYDTYPSVKLTVSDIRKSILHNLDNRFKRAGIVGYHSFVADVSATKFSLNKQFDLVICDAPCSGSGTWSRTPEQLHFFEEEKIMHYAELQKKIAVNAGKCLKKNGLFLYITCSVFKKENEEVVAFIQKNTSLQLKEKKYFTGYDKKADTLFAALFSL